MKKIYSLCLMVFAIASTFAQDAGIFESYVVLNAKNAGNVYYDMQATTDNLDFNGANLGTFADTESLIFAGGENKTWKNNGGDVTGGKILYSVYSTTPSGTFSEVTFGFLEDLGNGNQKWGSTAGATNLISGLAAGTYTLEVYSEASTNVGTKYSSNGGANYIATFEVTSTLATTEASLAKKSAVVGGKLYTAKKGILNLTIYDFSGRLIKKMSVKSDGNAVELNLQNKGNYILNLSDAKSTENVKFAY